MKKIFHILFILLLAFCARNEMQSQPCSPPAARSWLYIADAGQEHDTLWFGFDSSATCGVDPNLCELDFWWPCGDPPGPPLFCSYWYSWCPRGEAPLIWHDYRNFHSSAQVDTYQVGFGAGPSGYPMTFKWNRLIVQNICDSSVITDRFGGIFCRMRMDLQDSLVVSAEYITSLYLIKYGAKQPVSDVGGEPLSLPRGFHLWQNYPNPFNPSTKIRFEVRTTSFVSLEVFNVLCQEVVRLVKEEKQPGRYEVTWDAGRQASGVYFYRLQSGTYVATKKLMIIR